MRESLFETIVGLVVVAVAGTFLMFSLNQRSNAAPGVGGSYELHTRFRDGSGLTAGTDVVLAGVKVGTVTKVELVDFGAEGGQPGNDIAARVTFAINGGVNIAKTWSAKAEADSLLGGVHMTFMYVAPDPDEDYRAAELYKNGDEVPNAGGVGNITTMLSGMAQGNAGVNGGEASPAPAAPASAAPQE
jgi:phospholipid/cholesterol/gamma-HCH transport system substrate-binding protein